MAKKNTEEEIHTSIDDLNDSLTGIGQKVQQNSSALMWAGIILAAVVAAVLIYIYAVRQPGIEKANDAIGQADFTLLTGNDSLALEEYKAVANDYGYDAGNRAHLNAAILLYQKGDYKAALEMLDDYSPADDIIGANALALEGDCYVNLQDYDKALGYFDKAISRSDKNPYFTPAFMMKKANVLRELKKYAEEADIYRQITQDYPNYGSVIGADIEKYQRRAELQAKGE